jgi:hypothetical protein
MFRLRDAATGFASFALLFTLVSGAGCGTDAKAVDECRDIEQARCEAAKPCGLVEDVDECQRFYRDHCLHGMVVASPGKSQIERCVATIKRAGVCAAGNVEATLEECPDVTASSPLTLACDVVLYPENTTECDFLSPDPPTGGGTGGTTGADPDAGDSFAARDGGSDAGAGGMAGSPGSGGATN